VKNFVRERRRESCRERSLAYKRKHVFGRQKMKSEDIIKISKDTHLGNDQHASPISEPAVSDFIDLKIWKRKRVCCGTIFVGPYGEAIVDPRFLNSCHNPRKQNIRDSFTQSLLSFETIVEKELKDLKNSTNNLTEEKRNASDSRTNNKFPSLSDHDEGFFDRSSISPCFEDNI